MMDLTHDKTMGENKPKLKLDDCNCNNSCSNLEISL